jgi:hypothetical protein
VDRPPIGRGPSAQHKLLLDSPRVEYGPSSFRGALQVVLLRLTDCPLEGRGPSARAFTGQLSPLLLELCFHFGIV